MYTAWIYAEGEIRSGAEQGEGNDDKRHVDSQRCDGEGSEKGMRIGQMESGVE